MPWFLEYYKNDNTINYLIASYSEPMFVIS